MTLTYRQGSIKDRKDLQALKIAAYSEYENILTPDNRAILNGFLHNDAIMDGLIRQSTVFVCTDNAAIVGMAFIVPSGNPTHLFSAEWSHIRMVAVHPQYRGLGIARQLTRMCVQYAIQTKEKTIALHTSEFMDAARHIYESLGFTILKEIAPLYGKRYWIYTMQIEHQEKNRITKDFNFNDNIIIEDERVRIEPLTLQHTKYLKAIILKDTGLMKYSFPSVTTGSELDRYIDTALQGRQSSIRYPFVVFDKSKGRYAGSTSYMFVVNEHRRLEIGYTWIGFDYQSTGLNTAMKYLMLQYAFEELGFSRVEFRADSRNMQSRTAIAKIGATFEGELRSCAVKQNGFRSNTVIYSILESEWPDVKTQLAATIEQYSFPITIENQ